MSDRSASKTRRKPTIAIELVETSARWRERLPRRRALCIAAAEAAFAAAKPKLTRRTEVSVVLADDALVRRLNRQWRRIDAATNVLSFPALDLELPPKAPLLLGDVVLAFETVSREAQEQGKELADHLRHLVVHGVLHLIGYDHEEPGGAEQMEALETQVLARLGVADPYAERQAVGDD
ncbi:MAG TPA: rRNA maturation RNase YbeY [Stellaceae bacterium]|nr:rRNA maturation RNase YbeY [Stellaceae bacterium]